MNQLLSSVLQSQIQNMSPHSFQNSFRVAKILDSKHKAQAHFWMLRRGISGVTAQGDGSVSIFCKVFQSERRNDTIFTFFYITNRRIRRECEFFLQIRAD